MANKKTKLVLQFILDFTVFLILTLIYLYFTKSLQYVIEYHHLLGLSVYLFVGCSFMAIMFRIVFTLPWNNRSIYHKVLSVAICVSALGLFGYNIAMDYLNKKPYKSLDYKTSHYENQLSTQADHYLDTLKLVVSTYYPKFYGYSYKNLNREKLISKVKVQKQLYINLVKSGLGRYGKGIDAKILSYLTLVSKIHNEAVLGKEKSILDVYDIYEGQNKLSEKINMKLIGFPDVQSAENAYIMSLVPEVIQQLKQHPNDYKLCTVMTLPMTGNHDYQDAEKIAFMQIGAKYCNHYYTLRSSWGQLASGNDRENQYSHLSYQMYFDKYVKPLIPEEIKQLQKQPERICEYHGFNNGPRNPKLDAMRQAYLLKGKQYCPQSSLKPKYFSTGYFCLVMGGFPSSKILDTDLVEQCKETPGIIF